MRSSPIATKADVRHRNNPVELLSGAFRIRAPPERHEILPQYGANDYELAHTRRHSNCGCNSRTCPLVANGAATAAAPQNVRYWPKADMTVCSAYVRFRG